MNENNNMLQQNNTQIQQNHIQQNKSVYHQASAVDRHLHTISTYNYLSEDQKKEIRDMETTLIEYNNLERNQTLISQVYAGMPPQIATNYAQASFKPLQAPAKETYKQKKERKRQEKLAKEAYKEADHFSFGMVQSLQKTRDNLNNSVNSLPENLVDQIQDNNIDTRVIKCYCNGFKVNANGQPATWVDQNIKDIDMEFCEDYASKDLTKRRPHLDHILGQLLNTEISMDMFSYSHLKEHAGEVRLMCTRFTYFKNVYEDPINKPYFEELSPKLKELIKIRILDQYEPMNQALAALLGSKAVNINDSDYIKNEGFAIFRHNLSKSIDNLSDSLKNNEEKTNKLLQIDGELKTGIEKNDIPAYALLKNCQQMMNSNESQYNQNMGIIDKIYQELLPTVDAITHLTYSINQCKQVLYYCGI